MIASPEPLRVAPSQTISEHEPDFAAAEEALRALRPLRHPRLREAAAALGNNQPEFAEQLLSAFLKKHPRDADALHIMADIAMRLDRHEVAETLLAKCLKESPDFEAARLNYASALYKQNKLHPAMAELDKLLNANPENLLFRYYKAFVLTLMGRHAEALNWCRHLAEDYPDSAKLWIRYGNALRTMGLRAQCITAYRKAIELSSPLGYWSLGDLKTYRFTEAEIAGMQVQLVRSDLSADDRTNLYFALGKAYADQQLWDKSFDSYARANALRRLAVDYDPDWTTAQVSKFTAVFTPQFLRDRSGSGCGSSEPIFIVGMQRAGSTLVEQIISSHPAVEGAGELQDIGILARRLHDVVAPKYDSEYPGMLGSLDGGALRSLAEDYLNATHLRRSLERPFFTDKEPYNFWHVGFIHLMFPNARIIDVRRHPLACCLSIFTTKFRKPLPFSYRLSDLGRYYRDYAELMEHFDRVLPGRVYRIIYEQLVAEPEFEVRRLLGHLGLPFDDSCLQFERNERPLNSVSNEQVRKPIFQEGVNRWRAYEPWLGPLKASLGPVLHTWAETHGAAG